MIAKKEYRPEPLRLISNAPALNYNPNLSAYDGLTAGGEAHVEVAPIRLLHIS